MPDRLVREHPRLIARAPDPKDRDEGRLALVGVLADRLADLLLPALDVEQIVGDLEGEPEVVRIALKRQTPRGVGLAEDRPGHAGDREHLPRLEALKSRDPADVEIGAHSAVDRPAVGETRIAAGTKIDNLVQVAHGVRVGRNVLLAAQAGIAGSTVLEDGVVMAGQSGATGHVRLGKGVVVGAKSVVTKDLEPGQHVTGMPAVDVAEWRESVVLIRKLAEMRRTLASLEAELKALRAKVL